MRPCLNAATGTKVANAAMAAAKSGHLAPKGDGATTQGNLYARMQCPVTGPDDRWSSA